MGAMKREFMKTQELEPLGEVQVPLSSGPCLECNATPEAPEPRCLQCGTAIYRFLRHFPVCESCEPALIEDMRDLVTCHDMEFEYTVLRYGVKEKVL